MKVGQLRMLFVLLSHLKKILKICLKFQDVFTPAWFRPFKAKSSVISLLVAVCLCKLNTDHTQVKTKTSASTSFGGAGLGPVANNLQSGLFMIRT